MVKLIRPTWYNEEFYSKERSPEEWLFELSKRYALEQQLHVISHLEIAEQEKCFIKNIFNEQIDKYLESGFFTHYEVEEFFEKDEAEQAFCTKQGRHER